MTSLRIGSRKSKLALIQSNFVADKIRQISPDINIEIIHFQTQGDRNLSQALAEIGGKGVFTAELEHALLNHKIDLAVHSLKDLPTTIPEGTIIGAIPERASVADIMISRNGYTLETLPHGSVIGTGSARRAAQLLNVRPDLQVRGIRGNVDTRIAKALLDDSEWDAIILALAGVQRLGIDIGYYILPLETVLPAPGQGALAVQCRKEDAQKTWLTSLTNIDALLAVNAERAFLEGLEAGCAMPVAAFAQINRNTLKLHARMLSADGQIKRDFVHETNLSDDLPLSMDQAKQLGESLANEALQSNTRSLIYPLYGKRIVVTRAKHQAESLILALQDEKAVPLPYPCIDIQPVGNPQNVFDALGELQQNDWIVFTSTNAVIIFRDLLQAVKEKIPDGINVGVIGKETAKQFHQVFGAQPDLIPATETSKGLAEGLRTYQPTRVLLPQSSIASPILADSLRNAGIEVHALPIYDTIEGSGGVRLQDELAQGIDALTFTSPSTVKYCLTRFQREGGENENLFGIPAFCIGNTTGDAAKQAGFENIYIAQKPEHNLLVSLMSQTFQKGNVK